MSEHVDKAKLLWARLQTEYEVGGRTVKREPVAEIAAALAAAERAGWIAGRDAAAAVAERSGYIGGSVAVASAIRALLPAAVAEPEPSGISGELPAEPAAKCATCGITHPADHSCTPAVDPQKCECRECKVCCAEPAAKCATCQGTKHVCRNGMCPGSPGAPCCAPCPSCGGAR